MIVVICAESNSHSARFATGKRRNFNVDTKGKLVPLEEDFEGIREVTGAAVKRKKEDVCIGCGLQ
jgi:hypothetical protein